MNHTFRAQFGSYWINLPRTAIIKAEMKIPEPTPKSYQTASTSWNITLRRFQLSVHLDPLGNLNGLKDFIDSVTKSDVIVPTIIVNGIDGVTHGDYWPPQTWIDWWFKKGDLMICMHLGS